MLNKYLLAWKELNGSLVVKSRGALGFPFCLEGGLQMHRNCQSAPEA